MSLKRYTVLLLYPDYASAEFGHDTYQAHVLATSAERAVEYARKEVCREALDIVHRDDLYVLAVYAGWLDDIKEG